MACDICMKTGGELVDLLEVYQTNEIKQVCCSCERELNSHLWKMKRLTDGLLRTLLKEYMANKRAESLVSRAR